MSDSINEDFLDSCCKLIANAFIYNLNAIEVRIVCFRHQLEAEQLHEIIFFDVRDAS